MSRKMKKFLKNIEARVVPYTIVALLVIAGISSIFVMFPSVSTLSLYHKQCNITNAVNNYQMKIIVGNNSGGNVSIPAGHLAHGNFSDIHFTDIDDYSELDFYMVNYTLDTQATFWVKTPSDAVADAAINLNYGNSSQTISRSNGSATFPVFFDDFEDGDVSDWDRTNPYGNLSANNTYKKFGSYSARVVDTDTSNIFTAHKPVSFDNKTVCFWTMSDDVSACYGYLHLNYDTTYNHFRVATSLHTSNYYCYDGSWDILCGMTDFTWEYIELQNCSFTDNVYDCCFNGSNWYTTLVLNNQAMVNTGSGPVAYLHLGASDDAQNEVVYFDNIWVREYSDTEPTWSFFGDEQTDSSIYAIVSGYLDSGYVRWNGASGETVFSNDTVGAGNNLTVYVIMNLTENCTDICINVGTDKNLGDSNEIDFDSSSGNSELYIQVGTDDTWSDEWMQFTDGNSYNISLNTNWDSISDDPNPFNITQSDGNTSITCIFKFVLTSGLSDGTYLTSTYDVWEVKYKFQEV